MEFILRNIDGGNTLTFMLLGGIGVLVVLKLLYQNQFMELLALVNNGKYFLLHNKRTHKSNLFNAIFFVFFTTMLGVYGYLFVQNMPQLGFKINNLFGIVILINVFMLVKHLLEKLVFEILDLLPLYDSLNFQKVTYYYLIGFVVFGFNVFFTYVLPNPSENIVLASLVVLLLLYLGSMLLLVTNHLKLFLNHWFYFILYLCAFKVSPALFIFLLIK